MKNNIPLVGISIGDVSGIGPEVIMKTFSDKRMLSMCIPVIYSSPKIFIGYKKILDIDHFNFNQINKIEDAREDKVNLLNCFQYEHELTPGKPSKESGNAAFQSLKHATKDLQENKLDALVTAPIDKQNIQNDEFNFAGHTEYLTKELGANESLMFLVNNILRIGVVTGHIPVHQITQHVSISKIVDKATLMHKSLKKDFGIQKPKIAVLGLNPHAGDNGIIGNEEEKVVLPAITQLKEKGILAYGPLPADGFFGTFDFKRFDGVLAMYHDQGLIPFKTIAFEDGVNFTAGLKKVRTSPDHGTAFGIAGQGLANETSFREAVYTACDIVRKRKEE